MKLPCKRFVKQVSNGGPSQIASYTAMMQSNAGALESEVWIPADCPRDEASLIIGDVYSTDGIMGTSGWERQPTYTSFLNHRFDAFAQAGDADKITKSMCGYAGCVAYRFSLPELEESRSDPNLNLTSMSIAALRDRFLRAGVRIAAYMTLPEMLNTPEPDINTFSWETIRNGSYHTDHEAAENINGVSSWGFMNQKNVPYLNDADVCMETWTPNLGEGIKMHYRQGLVYVPYKYLWIFLTLEDYVSYWDKESSKKNRAGYIEGSAMIISSLCDFEFNDSDLRPPSGNAGIIVYDSNKSLLSESRTDIGETIYAVSPVSAVFSRFLSTCHNALRESAGTFMHDDFYWDSISGVPRIGMQGMNNLAAIPGDYGFGLFAACKECRIDISENYFCSGISLFLGYLPVIVPEGEPMYSKISIELRSDIQRNKMDVGINIWDVHSLDARGPLDWIAFSALAKNNAFFTAYSRSVSGKVTTSLPYGSTGQTYEVSASADLIAKLRVPELIAGASGSTWIDINIPSVKSGDVLLFSPNVKSMNPQDANDLPYFRSGSDDVLIPSDMSVIENVYFSE